MSFEITEGGANIAVPFMGFRIELSPISAAYLVEGVP